MLLPYFYGSKSAQHINNTIYTQYDRYFQSNYNYKIARIFCNDKLHQIILISYSDTVNQFGKNTFPTNIYPLFNNRY